MWIMSTDRGHITGRPCLAVSDPLPETQQTWNIASDDDGVFGLYTPVLPLFARWS